MVRKLPAWTLVVLHAGLLVSVADPGTGIVRDDSIVAVVTDKSGFASGLAHDHLVVASSYTARLELDDEDPTSATFDLEIEVEDLVVDLPALQARWYPRLHELGIQDEPFVELSDGRRDKIRGSMLGKKQLDAERHPGISASVVGIRELPADEADPFPYEVTLALEVHGKRVERPVRARYEVQDGRTVIEATGRFRFTDFGIEPFSAMLGAVRNEDEFDVYLFLTAIEEP